MSRKNDNIDNGPQVSAFFNPYVDLAPVDQFGFLDLRKAFVSGVVDGAASFEDRQFNGIDNPDSIMHSPKDNFESLRQAEYVRSTLKEAKNKVARAAAEKAAAEAAAAAGGGGVTE